MKPAIGMRVTQTRPTAWLKQAGATGGFQKGLIVCFDASEIVIARDSDRKEVRVPRRLLETP